MLFQLSLDQLLQLNELQAAYVFVHYYALRERRVSLSYNAHEILIYLMLCQIGSIGQYVVKPFC